jgi:hypothetical protein
MKNLKTRSVVKRAQSTKVKVSKFKIQGPKFKEPTCGEQTQTGRQDPGDWEGNLVAH